MNIAAHNPKFLNGLSITRLLSRIAILTSQLDGAKKQITTMTSQIMDLTSQNTAYLQRINELERSATLDGSDSHMAHFFLSETFVPYRGLVPGLRP